MTTKIHLYISLWFKVLLPIFSGCYPSHCWTKGCLMFDPKRKRPCRSSGVFPDSHLFPFWLHNLVFCLCLFLKAQVATVFRTTSLASDTRVYCRKQIIVDSFSFITHDSHLGLWPYLGTWNQLRWLQDKICYALFIYLFFTIVLTIILYRKQKLFQTFVVPKSSASALFIELCIYTRIYWGAESLYNVNTQLYLEAKCLCIKI